MIFLLCPQQDPWRAFAAGRWPSFVKAPTLADPSTGNKNGLSRTVFLSAGYARLYLLQQTFFDRRQQCVHIMQQCRQQQFTRYSTSKPSERRPTSTVKHTRHPPIETHLVRNATCRQIPALPPPSAPSCLSGPIAAPIATHVSPITDWLRLVFGDRPRDAHCCFQPLRACCKRQGNMHNIIRSTFRLLDPSR